MYPAPISKILPLNTGFVAYSAIHEISISKSLEVTHWVGKPQEKKLNRNVTFPVDGNQEKTIKEAAVCGAHHIVLLCVCSFPLTAMSSGALKVAHGKTKPRKPNPPYAKPAFFWKILWVTFYPIFSEAFTRSSPEGRVIPLCPLSNFCSWSYQL